MTSAQSRLTVSASQLTIFVLLLLASSVFGQSQFYLTFRGTSYQTNGSGNIVPVPITEKTILQQAGQSLGTDPSNLALIYHVFGHTTFGDTDAIEIVNATSGAAYSTFLGLYFSDSTSYTPDRFAITNAAQTEVRRIDYVYNGYTHSMGGGFLTKRFLSDGHGNVRTTIDANIHWIVPSTPKAICKASFTTTRPFP
jgi:hypothetical protein